MIDDVDKALRHHVIIRDNQGDVVSRDRTTSELIKKALWWYGRSWLKDEKSPWTAVKDVPLESVDTPLEENSKSI